jgi:hypothetical protein
LTSSGKMITKVAGVDPKALAGRPLVLRAGGQAQTSVRP